MGKVLLTGGNGFIGVHIILQLLAKNHTVVATVRSTEKAAQTLGCVPEPLRSKVTFSIVENAGAANAFDQTIKETEFDAVIHTATPFTYNIKDPHELFDPAVIGTQNILEAVHEYGPTVNRVVVLSSCASVADPSKGARPGYTYTEADWNPITKEQALSGDPGLAYYGAKTHSEKVAWEFIANKKPHFSLVTLCPPLVFGPVVNHVKSTKDLGTSNAIMFGLVDGSQKGGEIPPSPVWAWVDVRDVAEALVIASDKKDVANERFLITAGIYTNKDLVDAFRRVAPPEYVENLPTNMAAGLLPDGKPEGGLFGISNEKSRKLLGINYHGLEDMLEAFITSVKPLRRE